MRAAILRFAAGKSSTVPLRVWYHLIAARYSTTPDAVRLWPADDFTDACSFYGVTDGRRGSGT